MIKFMSFFSFYFDMKKCSKCNRLLPESSFKLRKGKLYYMCRECEKEYMREYRQRNKNHINKQHSEYMREYKKDETKVEHLRNYSRNYMRKRNSVLENNYRGRNQLRKGQTKYTKAQIIKMSRYNLTPEQFDALPDYCEVCGSTTNLCIDHDHSTGKVRGTLCSRCNQALGLMRDNHRNIIKLANYLIKDETVQI